MIPVCLSGPLNPAVCLVLTLIVFSKYFIRYIKNVIKTKDKIGIKPLLELVPTNVWICFIPIVLLSLYSLYAGRFNSHETDKTLSFIYASLLIGIKAVLTVKLGFSLLLGLVIINGLVIFYIKSKNKDFIKNAYYLLFAFSIIYILLLPLGGYRVYRPQILRFDTVMPVTLGLIFVFGLSTNFIINHISSRSRPIFYFVFAVVVFIYTNAELTKFRTNECEKSMIKEIIASKDSIVKLSNECTCMEWRPETDPNESELNIQQLIKWGVLNDHKLYYHE